MSHDKTAIHVSRYENPEAVGYRMAISPTDNSWCLFVDKDGKPSLWLNVPGTIATPDGNGEEYHDHLYMPAQMAYAADPSLMAACERVALDEPEAAAG